MTPVEIRAVLKAHSVLASLPDDALDGLIRKGRATRFAKGVAIYQRGDDGDSLMIILSGRVKITNITADAREVALNFLGPGDLNGELAALDGKPRSANASALEATEALVIWRRDLLPALEQHPKAMLEIIAALAGKVRLMSAAVEQSGLQMAAKAAGALLRLAEQHGKQSPSGLQIDLKLSQRDLGAYAGLSRENMNRQLSALKDEGLIRVDGAIITILDLEGLELAADAGE
jgi:CRP/FNR family transcriptional regulator, cyclic AMP receptor protein